MGGWEEATEMMYSSGVSKRAKGKVGRPQQEGPARRSWEGGHPVLSDKPVCRMTAPCWGRLGVPVHPGCILKTKAANKRF